MRLESGAVRYDGALGAATGTGSRNPASATRSTKCMESLEGVRSGRIIKAN